MKLIRYEGENVTPSDDAILYRQFLSDGLFAIVTPTFTSGAITIPAMRGVICGRDFTTDIEELTAILASAGTITGQIYMWIDMADETYPLSIKIRNSVGSLSDDDINNGGQYYGLEIAQYTANTSAVTGVTLTCPVIAMSLPTATDSVLGGVKIGAGIKIEDGIISADNSIVGQVAFPATQNPSADPNTLDDYEEGTFTPTIIGVGSAGIGTYTGQVGQYTKIGKIVFFSIYVGWTAHTGAGAMYVGNLPFNTSSVAASYSSLNVWQNGIAVGSGLVLTAYTNINQNSISLNKYNASTGVTSEQPVVNAGALMLSGHFFTS